MNRVGVVDIGSNTIRAVVYEKGEVIYNRAVLSRIFEFTDNGSFTEEGGLWLCGAINALRASAPECETFYAYATSAFRDLKNGADVAAAVREATGTELCVLSEAEEAMCDIFALADFGVTNGTGIDLGGGSCQIFEISDGKPGKFASLAIGCNRLCKRFVAGEMPTKDEIKEIAAFVTDKVNGFKSVDTLCVLGGTSRLALKIRESLNGIRGTEITPSELCEIVGASDTERGLSAIRAAAKERSGSATVGIAVIAALADKLGAKTVRVCKTSSREGFLIMKKLEKEHS